MWESSARRPPHEAAGYRKHCLSFRLRRFNASSRFPQKIIDYLGCTNSFCGMFKRDVVCTFLLLIAGSLNAFAVSPTLSEYQFSSSNLTLYHFARQAAAISRQADEMDKNGDYGQGLRDAFKDRIGLSDADSPLVLKLMVVVDADFAALDAQANAIILKGHQEFESTGVLPPPRQNWRPCQTPRDPR